MVTITPIIPLTLKTNNPPIIKITLQKENQTITLKSSLSADLLDILKIFSKFDPIEKETNMDEDYDSCYPRRISPQLKRNKNFIKDFNEWDKHFLEWCLQRYGVPNLIEISQKDLELSMDRYFNKKEWRKFFASLFTDIIPKNVECLMIHISSNLPLDEITIIFDDITYAFSHIPIKTYYSYSNGRFTLVEIIYFGSNLLKYHFEDED